MDTAKSANPKVILVGSPNVGKSVIFGLLTGRYATVSNYPGTTVEVLRGEAKTGGRHIEVVDTPGLYSVYPITEEERVTLKIIENEPGVIVHVIDAKNLERSLALTLELLETGRPVIVVLNMFDELLSLNLNINTGPLSERLGVPVVATVAVTNQGMDRLSAELEKGVQIPISGAAYKTPAYSETRIKNWYKKAAGIARDVMIRSDAPRRLTRLDRLLISPVSGFLILALILYLGLYKFVGSFGAGTLVDILENAYEGYASPFFSKLAEILIPWSWLRPLFVGEYGILTLGLRYALAIILPIVTVFFFVFALIEDSGYLPRLAYLMDSIFKRMGLSGRAVIPMVLGLGCDTMATMVVRTLATRRERLIATILLSLTIPCSAQLGVIMGLLADKPVIIVLWAAIILGVFVVGGAFLSRILPGPSPTFIIEIPPMRLPKIRNVLLKTYVRLEWYIKEIIPIFIIASALIWLGQITGVFETLVRWLSYPLELMGLPVRSAPAFLFGFFRRDYGAAGLYDLHSAGGLNGNQLLIAVVVLTLFLPCIAQLLITIKERGLKVGAAIAAIVLLFAFAAGVALNSILNYSGINL